VLVRLAEAFLRPALAYHLALALELVVGEMFQRTVIPEQMDGCSKSMEEYVLTP
jgi:hypothetical protein